MSLSTRSAREEASGDRRTSGDPARWTAISKALAPALACAALLGTSPTASLASDGCTVLLCLAGNWRSIGQCVPPVSKALRDLALGRSFPVCGFASAPSLDLSVPSADAQSSPTPPQGTSSAVVLRWADASFCPSQYRTTVEGESSATSLCSFSGAIEVSIGGQLWNRTWWNLSGDSVTEWTPTARAAVPQTAADDRFERDYETWKAQQGSSAPPPVSQPEGGA